MKSHKIKVSFKLRKWPAEIRIYDVYLAIEGQQSLYSTSGVLDDMLNLEDEHRCCLLEDLMEKAESSWKSVLKQETIASLDIETNDRFQPKVQLLQEWIKEKMVL